MPCSPSLKDKNIMLEMSAFTLSIISIGVMPDLEGISKTIASVDEQDVDEVEHLCIYGKVDDLCGFDRWKKPSRRFFLNQDKGLYDAMNIGLLRAKGDYVFFLNSGDSFFSSHTLREVLSELDGTDAIVFGSAQTYEDLQFIRRYKIGMSPRKIPHQGVVIRRNIAQKFWFDVHRSIDADSRWLQQVLRGTEIKISKSIISRFSLGGVSNFPTIHTAKIRLFEQGKQRFLLELLKFSVRRMIGNRNYYLAMMRFWDLKNRK